MNKYTVQVNDTPASIAARITGQPARMHELVNANPGKGRMLGLGAVPTFASLQVGEVLNVPSYWARGVGAAHIGLGDCTPTSPLPDITTATQSLETLISNSQSSGAQLCTSPYPSNQETCDFQAAYNATNPTAALPSTTNPGATASTLANDGELGPATLAALNLILAGNGAGYSYSCTGGIVQQQTNASTTPTTPTTPTSTTTTTTTTATSATPWIVAGVVAASAVGAYYWLRHKGGAAKLGAGATKAKAHVKRLGMGAKKRVAARRRRR